MEWNDIISIIITTVIGSVLAGSTNHLAVQMLFRPYEPIFIGKWQVPFTPGIIPKRRLEMAKSLGETVETYLLTPTLIREKFLNATMQEKIECLLISQWETLYNNDKTLREYAEKYDLWKYIERGEQNLGMKVSEIGSSIIDTYSAKTPKDVLGDKIQIITHDYLPKMSVYTLLQASNYVESDAGKEMISNVITNFLTSKGKFGGFINSMVKDSESLNNKIRLELINVLRSKTAYEKVYSVMYAQLENVTNQPIQQLISIDSQKIGESLGKTVIDYVNIDERSQVTLKEQFPRLDAYVREQVIPKIVAKLLELAEQHIDKAITSFNVAAIVEQQVNSFPVEQLEKLLLGVSKKEFQLITYFGFVIGAFIGFVQGIVTVFL